MLKENKLYRKISSAFVIFLVLIQSLLPASVLAQEASTSSEPQVSPTESVSPSPSPSPTVTPEVLPSPSPSATLEPQISPSPADQTTTQSNPQENIGQPNAPPSESPNPSLTPEPSPSVVTQQPSNGHISAAILHNTAANNIALDLNPSNITASATLTTDKADYAPTDTAVITGIDFPKSTDLNLIITAENYRFETNIKTDTNGSFIYSYQLDGTFRPLYTVEAYNLSGQLLATVTFTDSNPFPSTTLNGVACLQDQPKSPNNLNCTANDISLAQVSNIQIQGHGCRFPGDTVTFSADWQVKSNASTRYNAGLWFATAGQTSALHGTCSATTLPSSPSPFFENGSDSCGDITSNGTGTVNILMTASCIDTQGTNLLNLPYCTSWQQNELSCTTPADAVPGTPSKCNCQNGFQIPITVPFGAHIEVVKHLNPTNDPGTFNLQIDGATTNTSACVGNNGTTGSVSVGAGTNQNPGATHTVGENVTSCGNTNLGNYTTSMSCVNRGTATFHGGAPLTASGTGPLNVNVVKDDDIVCTVTNNVNQGSLTVIKHVIGGSATASQWTMHIKQSSVDSVTPFAGAESPGTTKSLTPGNYNVSETDGLAEYTLSYSGSCDSQGNVTVTTGQTATCTLVNTRDTGSVLVHKLVDTDGNGSFETSDSGANTLGFRWGLDGASPATNMGSTVSQVSTGSHSVNENSITNYHFVGWFNNSGQGSCTNPDSTSLPANMTVSKNSTTTITLCNGRDTGTITVNKILVPSNDQGKFDLKIDRIAYAVGVGNSGTTGQVTVLTGSHTVSEVGNNTDLSNYQQVIGGSCTSDGTVAVTKGENKVCTITNTRLGTIIVEKQTNPDGDQTSFTFTGDASGAISDEGQITISNLSPGTYTSQETVPAGWDLTNISCDDTSSTGNLDTKTATFAVSAGEVVKCTFTNTQRGVISGTKYEVNADQSIVGTLSDWVINLFSGNSQVAQITTDGSGNFSFTNVVTGAYTLVEQLLSGWTQIYTPQPITLNPGQSSTANDFGNFQNGTITGVKFNDINGNGQRDAGEPTLSGWTIFQGETSTQTTDSGYSFTDLGPGSYTVCEVEQSGWLRTKPSSSNCETVNLTNSSQTAVVDFGNQGRGSITVEKNVDIDGDGQVDVVGATDWTWDIADGEQNIATGQTRTLPTGIYEVSEDQKASYKLLDWSCSNEQTGTTSSITLDVTRDSHIICTITNQAVPPVLTLTKTNNRLGIDVSPGADVLYTLTVELSSSALSNVILTDLLPNGFVYRHGSWTALSSVRGDLKTLGITPEPTYASPGTWQLGDMISGEVVTLTLLANIRGDIDLGLYKDLAWTQGQGSNSQEVLGNKDSGVFVGTEVNVVAGPQGTNYEVEKKETAEVLGVSTALPQTGADSRWIILGSILFVSGLTLILTGLFIRRKYV